MSVCNKFGSFRFEHGPHSTIYDFHQIHDIMDPVHDMLDPVHDIMAGVQHIMAGVQHIMDGVQQIMDSAWFCIVSDFMGLDIIFFDGFPEIHITLL